MSAACEAVLMLINACRFERVLATPARVAVMDNGTPPLDTDEVRKLAAFLRSEQYITAECDVETGAIHYELTERGEEHCVAVACRSF